MRDTESGITATIATSIMPKRIAEQQKAINSWLNKGFRVISVNNEVELPVVSPMFEGVQFIPTKSMSLQPPLISIRELLDQLELCKSDIYAIINSDITLSAEEGLIDFIWENVKDGAILFGPRIDTEGASLSSGRTSSGYDYFFFNRNVFHIDLTGNFCLGATWWDYWFPISLGISGIRLRRFAFPIGLHQNHSLGWNKVDLEIGMNRFISAIRQTLINSDSSSTLSQRTNLLLNSRKFNNVAENIRLTLLLDSEEVFDKKKSIEVSEFEHFLKTYRGCLEAQDQILQSRSWRWTKAMRELSKWIHTIKSSAKNIMAK